MLISQLIAGLRAYWRYRESVRALSELTDKELADIGIARGDIRAAAWRAVQA